MSSSISNQPPAQNTSGAGNIEAQQAKSLEQSVQRLRNIVTSVPQGTPSEEEVNRQQRRSSEKAAKERKEEVVAAREQDIENAISTAGSSLGISIPKGTLASVSAAISQGLNELNKKEKKETESLEKTTQDALETTQETSEMHSIETGSVPQQESPVLNSFLNEPKLTTPLKGELESFYNTMLNQPALTAEQLEAGLQKLLSSLKDETTAAPTLSKEAQVWMFSPAVQLFTTSNLIISNLATMKKEWNDKMVDIKGVMLQMAKDMKSMMMEAGKLRSDQMMNEAYSMLAEGIMSFVQFGLSAGSLLANWIQSRSTSNTEQSIREQIQKEIKSEKPLQARIEDLEAKIQKAPDGSAEKTSLEKQRAVLEAQQNLETEQAKPANQQDDLQGKIKAKNDAEADLPLKKAEAEKEAAKDKLIAAKQKIGEAEAKIKELDESNDPDKQNKIKAQRQIIEGERPKVATAQGEVDAAKQKIRQELTYVDKKTQLEYKLAQAQKGEEEFHVMKEDQIFQKQQSFTQVLHTIEQMGQALGSGVTNMIKSGLTAQRAEMSAKESFIEALNQEMGRLFQMMQESLTTGESAKESIGKQIESLLEGLRSAQAVRVQ